MSTIINRSTFHRLGIVVSFLLFLFTYFLYFSLHFLVELVVFDFFLLLATLLFILLWCTLAVLTLLTILPTVLPIFITVILALLSLLLGTNFLTLEKLFLAFELFAKCIKHLIIHHLLATLVTLAIICDLGWFLGLFVRFGLFGRGSGRVHLLPSVHVFNSLVVLFVKVVVQLVQWLFLGAAVAGDDVAG